MTAARGRMLATLVALASGATSMMAFPARALERARRVDDIRRQVAAEKRLRPRSTNRFLPHVRRNNNPERFDGPQSFKRWDGLSE